MCSGSTRGSSSSKDFIACWRNLEKSCPHTYQYWFKDKSKRRVEWPGTEALRPYRLEVEVNTKAIDVCPKISSMCKHIHGPRRCCRRREIGAGDGRAAKAGV